jgi:hypothetical protein
MKIIIMLILIHQADVIGTITISPFEEQPKNKFATIQKCEEAAEDKKNSILKSSSNYLELGIVDVEIICVERTETKEGTI